MAEVAITVVVTKAKDLNDVADVGVVAFLGLLTEEEALVRTVDQLNEGQDADDLMLLTDFRKAYTYEVRHQVAWD